MSTLIYRLTFPKGFFREMGARDFSGGGGNILGEAGNEWRGGAHLSSESGHEQ
jgi:hypothetical protein